MQGNGASRRKEANPPLPRKPALTLPRGRGTHRRLSADGGVGIRMRGHTDAKGNGGHADAEGEGQQANAERVGQAGVRKPTPHTNPPHPRKPALPLPRGRGTHRRLSADGGGGIRIRGHAGAEGGRVTSRCKGKWGASKWCTRARKQMLRRNGQTVGKRELTTRC